MRSNLQEEKRWINWIVKNQKPWQQENEPPRISDDQRDILVEAGIKIDTLKNQGDLKLALKTARKILTKKEDQKIFSNHMKNFRKLIDENPNLVGSKAINIASGQEVTIEQILPQEGMVIVKNVNKPRVSFKKNPFGLKNIRPVNH